MVKSYVDVACGCMDNNAPYSNGEVINEHIWSDCFIDTDGYQIYVMPFEHEHVASSHIGDDEYTYSSDLEEKGWVHFSLASSSPAQNYKRVAFTQKQMDTLFDIVLVGKAIATPLRQQQCRNIMAAIDKGSAL